MRRTMVFRIHDYPKKSGPKMKIGREPRPDLARSFGIILSPKKRNLKMFVGPFHENRQITIQKIMKNLTYANPLKTCLLYTSPSPRDYAASRMPSSA